MDPGDVVLATAVVPVVAATVATRTTTTAEGTATQARHWRTKVPRRIGRSTRWKEATDDGEGDDQPQQEQRRAQEAGAGVVDPQEQRPVPDVEPVGDLADVADRGQGQEAGNQAPWRADSGDDDAGGGQTDEEEPPRVGERSWSSR